MCTNHSSQLIVEFLLNKVHAIARLYKQEAEEDLSVIAVSSNDRKKARVEILSLIRFHSEFLDKGENGERNTENILHLDDLIQLIEFTIVQTVKKTLN